MRNTRNFMKRNVLEMLRDPLIYVFCLGFPLVMLILFTALSSAFGEGNSVFEIRALLPGIILFSSTFLMLSGSLVISKDRSTAFLVRLYTSPMKSYQFVLGYVLPLIGIAVVQAAVCILGGWICALSTGANYFSFGAALLLILQSLPMAITSIFFGVLTGTLLNDKAAPAITSAFITAACILGGAWMPLDVMGGFETFCRFLPFYPSVYIGRVITGAAHTATEIGAAPLTYTFDSVAQLGLIPIILFLVASVVASLFAFGKKMRSGN